MHGSAGDCCGQLRSDHVKSDLEPTFSISTIPTLVPTDQVNRTPVILDAEALALCVFDTHTVNRVWLHTVQ